MKVVNFKNDSTPTHEKRVLLPLREDKTEFELDKHNSIRYDLRTVPTQDDSPKYQYQLRVIDGTESIRVILRWRQAVDKVTTGLNVERLETRNPIVETSMRGQPLSLYHTSMLASATARKEAAYRAATDDAARQAVRATEVGQFQHLDDIAHALNYVVTLLLPQKVLARVKRALRRDTRKPADMTVRMYYQSLLRINYEEVPRLPPYGANQQLSQDEILDILLFGTPRSWQREMERQGRP